MEWLLVIFLSGYKQGVSMETIRLGSQADCNAVINNIKKNPPPQEGLVSMSCTEVSKLSPLKVLK